MIFKDAVEYGRLEDLIAGVTPTLSGWTVDPTDAADITDGDITSICTTGNRVAPNPYDDAVFQWDLGEEYFVMTSGLGNVAATVGSPYAFIYLYASGSWYRSYHDVAGGSSRPFDPIVGRASKVRLTVTSGAASTITPNIREFSVWRI